MLAVGLAVVGLAAAAPATAQTSYPFQGYRQYEDLGGAILVRIGDDPYPDLLAQTSQFRIRVLHNDGAGLFGDATDYLTPEYPRIEAVLDATGDGMRDIVVYCFGAREFAVLPGLGGGAFGAAVASPGPYEATAVTVVEVTGDGVPDILACAGAALELYAGVGGGAFGPGEPVLVAPAPIRALESADLSGDGRGDVVLVTRDVPGCLVLLGQPGGGLAEPSHLDAPAGASSLALADTDADGSLDILIGQTNEESGNSRGVWVFRGDGLGGFAQGGVFVSTGRPGLATQPSAIGVADLDGDGLPDLAVGGEPLLLMRGTGDPAAPFADPVLWGMTSGSGGFAFADIDGDADTDMATARGEVFLNEGEGSFMPPAHALAMEWPARLAAGDLNEDGTPDLAILGEAVNSGDGASELSLLLTDGLGGYEPTAPIPLPCDAFEFDLPALDADAPGVLDVMASDGDNIVWLPNLGRAGGQWRGLDAPVLLQRDYADQIVGMHVLDFEFMGSETNTPDPDIVTVGSDSSAQTFIHTQRNDGDGAFPTEQTRPLAIKALDSASGDIDLDGDIDLVIVSQSPSSSLYTRLNQVVPSFLKERRRNAGVSTYNDVRLLDLTLDGALDAVVFASNGRSGGASLYANDGEGKLLDPVALFSQGGTAFDLGHINDDGWLDAAVVSGEAPSEFPALHVFLGDAQGAFHGPYVTPLASAYDGWGANDIEIVDIDADGQGEVAVAISNWYFGAFDHVVLLEPREPDAAPCPGDFNGDGVVNSQDVILYLNDWAAQRQQDCTGGGCSADTDDNGVVDSRDFLLFLNAWSAGC